MTPSTFEPRSNAPACRWKWNGAVGLVSAALTTSCANAPLHGSGSAASDAGAPSQGNEVASQPTLADSTDIVVDLADVGLTPFIAVAELQGSALAGATSFTFTVTPKPGRASKPASATYGIEYLLRRGYAVEGEDKVRLPIFGLYAGYTNVVDVEVRFEDDSATTQSLAVATAPYVDPTGIYASPHVLKARGNGDALGFDFFYIKSNLGTPIVIDSDGEVRWVGVGVSKSGSSIFSENGFLVGDAASTKFTRLELDGTSSTGALGNDTYTNFHHNIDSGKTGVLVEVDTTSAGNRQVENVLAEVDVAGVVLAEWDFGALLTTYMLEQGDDPSSWIRPGVDWFHMNAAVYDPRDDSIVASSRENFVLKVDYTTGALRWILGDPTKYWHSFASLRAKSLTLVGDGLFPIGQHAVSIAPDGNLLLFNDGLASIAANQPAGVALGETRGYSAVSSYTIDEAAFTAQEAWRFDHERSIYSDICSSAYETADGSVLANYAVAELRTKARLMGLDSARAVVFDFEYPTSGCNTSWNAQPIPFEALSFPR
jgi:arylsulfate sulfotransferase